jgi:preprotein translocase subunit SecF
MRRMYQTMFYLSMGLTIASIVVIMMYGLNLGIDFEGGSLIELRFESERPLNIELQDTLKNAYPDRDIVINDVGDKDVIIRTVELNENEHSHLISLIVENFPGSGITERRFDSIGPAIGKELRDMSVNAVVIVLLAIIVYIAFVFRKLSSILSSWAMGLSAIVAMAHDIIIPIGIFSLLGYYYDVQINAVFVAAILTVLGYSVSDTVVVFDRIRENVLKGYLSGGFGETIHRSVMQTLTRSLNTSFTTLLSLFAIYFFGGESMKFFSLALILGIFLGAYSSLFVATPILYWWHKVTGK